MKYLIVCFSILLAFSYNNAHSQINPRTKKPIQKNPVKKPKLNQNKQLKSPGVYIEEVPSGVRSIASVETSIPVFIGYSQKAVQNKRNATNQAIRISSFAEYTQIYGGKTTGYYLYESIQQFYQNGGKDCYIISVATTANTVSRTVLERGLQISRSVSAQLLLMPDAVKLPSADFYSIQGDMIDQCASLQDRFAILNTLQPTNSPLSDMQSFRDNTFANELEWAAVYYPWLTNTAGASVPPSGAVAGAYVKQDLNRGVWKAPANVSVSGISSLTNTLTRSQQDMANVSPSDGKSINTIVSFVGKGILIWGARTLAGNDNEWRYVPIKRMAIMLENSIQKGTNWAVFEPNDANLWSSIKTSISNYMIGLWRQGALQGTRPGQAFYVKCGLGETMTSSDVANKKLIIEIGFAPVRPAEFIIIRIKLDVH